MEQDEFEQMLGDTENRLDRLKALYEQWFQGIERLEPTVPRKEVERRLVAMRREQPRNTALRFRFQSLQQRWNTYQTYWQRTARQIEEGTYRRDLLRARRLRAQARGILESAAPTAAEDGLGPDLEIDIDIEPGGDFDVDAALDAMGSKDTAASPEAPAVALSPFGSTARKSTEIVGKPPPSPAPKKPVSVFPPPTPVGATAAGRTAAPRPSRPAGRAPDEERIREIYDRYLDARRENNERTDNVKFDTLARSIRQMVPKLQRKHAGKRIDFEVVVKDGRVGLKPVARK